MNKIILGILVGSILGTAIYSCAGGRKSIKFKNFPQRSDESSVWSKCKDGDYSHICKYYCTKYDKRNKCKKTFEKIKKRSMKLSLDQGYVVMSKSLFIKLLQE